MLPPTFPPPLLSSDFHNSGQLSPIFSCIGIVPNKILAGLMLYPGLPPQDPDEHSSQEKRDNRCLFGIWDPQPLTLHPSNIHAHLVLLGMGEGVPGQHSQEETGGRKKVSQVRICPSNQNPGHCQECSPALLQTLMRGETKPFLILTPLRNILHL